ncbi:caspase family protein [Aliiglaciecola lipolytica]|uniref:Peptidase C14 caspase domain-containing protein n=1 Tax=Aliiglaciecola lipolytica E3 TaxID=1127673 RepID=K6XVC4_9ALTE|nr:caspase family protein [Aliiglaciecola lipolytica]GAC15631.1 hypothetical protein GLIP_3010 [Aliiglaciecola lipolytica E3]
MEKLIVYCFALFFTHTIFAQNKTFLRIETGAHTAPINQVLATSDGKFLITAANDKTIRVWDIDNEKESRRILGFIGEGPDGMIHYIGLSPDNNLLAVAVHRGESHNKVADDQDVIRIYDFHSGDIIKVLDPQNTDDLLTVNFSDDGKYLISSSEDHSIHIWDVEQILNSDHSRPMHTIVDNNYYQRPKAVEMFKFADDYRIVSADYGSRFKVVSLYSLAQKKVINSFKAKDRLTHLAMSDRFIAVTGYEQQIMIFDHDLNHALSIPTDTQPTGLRFSNNGDLLLVGAKESTEEKPVYVAVFDVNNDFNRLNKYSKHGSRVNDVTFTNNGMAVSAGGDNNEIHIWSPVTSELLKTFKGVGNNVFAVGIADKTLAFGNTQRFRMDVNNYAPLEHTFDLVERDLIPNTPEDELTKFKRAQTEYADRRLKILPQQGWDLAVEDSVNQYQVLRNGWYYHEAFGFADDGTILSGGRGGEVRAYRLENNDFFARLTTDFIGHQGKVWDLASEGQYVVTGGDDQSVRIWNLRAVQQKQVRAYPMLNLFVSSQGEWIVWSKSGFYDASTLGDLHVGYHVNQAEDEAALFYSSDRFLKTLYRPDVITAILETGSEDAALQQMALQAQAVDSILPPKIQLLTENQKTQQAEVTLSFDVELASDPIQRIWLLRNEKFYRQYQGSDIAHGGRFEKTVELLPGINNFTLFAESKVAKSIASRVSIELDDSEWQARGRMQESSLIKIKDTPPELFLLIVGVSDYANANSQLKSINYAHIDAESVAKAFQLQQGKAFAKVVSKVLLNEDANRDSIKQGFNWLQQQVEQRVAYKKKNNLKSEDITLIFLAGHGAKVNEDFFFLGNDAKIEDIANTSVDIMLEAEVFTALPNQLIVMTDACHSGTMGGGVFKNIDSRELGKRLISLNDRAVFIINATQKDKPSYESSEIGHGIFTKVMLEALKTDNEVFIEPFITFIRRNVKRQTEHLEQGPQKPHTVTFGSVDDYLLHKN